MLVVLSNAVKVESVPLKSENFLDGTMSWMHIASHIAIVAASAPSHMYPPSCPQLHAALDADRPDVVLYDIGGMAGPVAADQWGVPSAHYRHPRKSADAVEDVTTGRWVIVEGPCRFRTAGLRSTHVRLRLR